MASPSKARAKSTVDTGAQRTISSFFASSARKRPTSPIDLTSEPDSDRTGTLRIPPSKKAKNTAATTLLARGTQGKLQHPDVQPSALLDETSLDQGLNRSLSSPGNNSEGLTPHPAEASASTPTRASRNKERWRLQAKSTLPGDLVAGPGTSVPTTVDAETRSRRENIRQKLAGRDLSVQQRWDALDVQQDSTSAPAPDDDQTETIDVDNDSISVLRERFTRNNAQPSHVRTKPKGKRKEPNLGPSGLAYTPLEGQVLRLKQENPGVLLLVEVGYKYRFFGEDAKIASRELGIACFPDRNFLTASIPLHRRGIHVKNLLSKGHKVGIISQIETAALKKAGDNKSGPFDRKLTHLYTAATYVDELDSLDNDPAQPSLGAAALVCVVEELRGGMGQDDRVSIGLVSVTPSTGDVIWDEFEDSHMRTELETRMAHIRPGELLLPAKKLSKLTEKMLTHFAGQVSTNSTSTTECVRVERFQEIMDRTSAFDYISKFYKQSVENEGSHANTRDRASENFTSGKLLATVVDFPKSVIIALAHTIMHLSAFGLASSLLQTSFFAKFLERTCMLLNANTLSNLEIYRNQTDGTEKGSLVWLMDYTNTKFGSRMLKSWIGRPLTDLQALQERTTAVDEILQNLTPVLERLAQLLKGRLPDLVKGLCRIQYGKCTPKELSIILESFDKISRAFDRFPSLSSIEFQSPLLRSIVLAVPSIKEPISKLLTVIDLYNAAQEKKDLMWRDQTRFPGVTNTKLAILAVEEELQDHIKEVRQTLRKPSAGWVSVSGNDYLVEIKLAEVKKVPVTWTRVSATKSVVRFHTPFVRTKLAEREQLRETLEAEAQKAYLQFLDQVSDHYSVLRDVTNKLAVADCLFSLAAVAALPGYQKPQFVDGDQLEIVDGRHPMVEAMRVDPFVPNSITLGEVGPRSKIITGPNMGGKSSCVRMIALIAIMSQIGSYVPASQVVSGLHDGVLTRMGASDELARGRSTFMVEMSETSDILKIATSKTIVILDELGRGTSTYDGMAIAQAVLEHLVENVRCKTLFITHYPPVATEVGRKYPDIDNAHMGFVENQQEDGSRSIEFLFRLSPGIAKGSFGIECARLAGVPDSVLSRAQLRSSEMQIVVESQQALTKSRQRVRILQSCLDSSTPLDEKLALVQQFKQMAITPI